MSKHIIDKADSHDTARMARYTELEKRERMKGPHPAVESLERRARPKDAAARSKAFLKIESESEPE